MGNGVKKLIRILAIGLVICVGLTFALFLGLIQQYQHNNALGSASHLIEINRQGMENVSSLLQKDQQIARELAKNINSGMYKDEAVLRSAISAEAENWNADDIYIYAEDGRCIDAEGAVRNNGAASDKAADTMREKETFSIVESQAEYSVATDTKMTVNGSRIVAVSVVHDLDTLIAKMGFTPFGGQGMTYITRQNGVKICQYGNGVRSLYNVLAYFDSGSLEKLTGDGSTIEEVMKNGSEGAFMFAGADNAEQYVVITPVNFMNDTLYIVSIVPRNVVNKSLNEFSMNIILISAAMVVIMAGMFALFIVLFLRRTRQYDEDVRTRERLFDLLVSRTGSVFMLLEEGADEPIYITSNTKNVLGDSEISIRKDGGGFVLSGGKNGDDRAISNINESLAEWDGTSDFSSGYIPYGDSGGFLRASLYPTDGARREYIGIVQDVTPEYRRIQSLREALTLADSANRAKTRFLSSVSHDIRTPLNAIINMARFLKQDLDDKEKAYGELDVISQSAQHLLGLINDVLDLSRIESGKMSFVNESFLMGDVIENVTDIVSPLCDVKKQKFTVELKGIDKSVLSGDTLRLNQILINLLNNAIKFTPEGGKICFMIEALESISNEAVPFRFTVADTGIGIADDRLKEIFDPFARSEDDAVIKTEGSGLGLAITKNFVEALGGTITVKSRLGEGSVFTVELSYAKSMKAAPQKVEAKSSQARFDGRRALVAEDNAINLSIAKMILEDWGFETETAIDGIDALERYRRNGAGYFDIIYLDIQMPRLDGYKTTEAIRESHLADAKDIPIVAMTANAFAEDVERARSAGMNAHVAKPIEPDVLRRVTEELLRGYKR